MTFPSNILWRNVNSHQKDKRKKSHPNMIKWINIRATIFFNGILKENQSVKVKYWPVFKRMCISDLLHMTLPLQKPKWSSCSLENLIILKIPSFEHFIWTSQIISCMLTKKTKLQFPLCLQICNIYVHINTYKYMTRSIQWLVCDMLYGFCECPRISPPYAADLLIPTVFILFWQVDYLEL